ncbi:uncharacterized protein LOC131848286 [Achroia grisella]|uniref:uncharacterized protein LOC131848286 n=1 Tax=Achroia grisella TaxID=688607 RepID=UPI0027D34E47|nr:uncharacterized protein LOC131848286 [Achroia grisella]
MTKFYLSLITALCLLRDLTKASSCNVAQICVTDLTDADCARDNMVLVQNSNIHGCCPRCELPTGTPDTGCTAPANCLSDGRYAPVQCKGDLFTGRCFCSDENGKRLFGQMWRDEASEMTCACSRRRAELEATESRSVTLHCTPNGDYEPLQCDNGICWCAVPKTGQPTVTPVPEKDMTRLPCYSTGAIGESYLRRCESVVQSLKIIHHELLEHGSNFIGEQITFCDYDGSYGSYQVDSGTAYCTGRDGTILGLWHAETTIMAGMNCNCARDSMIYFPASGKTVTAECRQDGNYRPNQRAGDKYYCVDTDGYMTKEGLMDAWPADYCLSYQ